MSKTNTVVSFNSKQRAAHTRAYNAAEKSAATYREVVAKLAQEAFPEGTTVAEFAKALSFDISMGKKATIEKAEANRRRSRIHDGLKNAGLLKVSQRAAQSQGNRRKAEQEASEGKTAADAADSAKKTMVAVGKAPTQRELFVAFNNLLDHASRPTLERMVNALATKLAEHEQEETA